MMSLGPFSGGGGGTSLSSPSSSNLSALAPPFTVDRSSSKPNSNPLLQFSELPYASSFGAWQYANPTASGLDTYKKSEMEADSTNVVPMMSTNDYNFQYSASQSNNTQSNSWSPLSSAAKTSADPFSFDPKVRGTYYPPYISSVTDEGTPLVALSDSGYDVLPSPTLVSANASAQVDYTQCLSGLEYTPSWGGARNGLVDAKRGKHAEVNGSLAIEKSSASDSAAIANYLNQGCNMVECEDIPEEALGSSCRQFSDVIGREGRKHSVMMEDMDNISFLAQKVPPLPFDSSTTSISDSRFTISESLAAGPCRQTPKNSSSYQNRYNSYGKGNQPISSCFSTSVSVTKSSPTLVIRPPPVGTGLASQKYTSHKTIDVVDAAPAHQNKAFGNRSPSRGKEPQILPNSESVEDSFWTSKLQSHKDETDELFSLSSSVVERPSSKVQNKDTLTMNHGSQFLNVNTLDGFSISDESILAIKSENFADCLDHHNPAVDSPCWKGAPSSPFAPFDAVETDSSHPFMKKIDECRHLDPQIHPVFPPLHDPITPSEKAGKDRVHQDHAFAATEHVSVGMTKSIPIPTSSEGVQFCKEFSKAGEKYDSPNPSESDSLLTVSGNNQLGDGGCNFATKKPNLQAAAVDTMITINDTAEGGAVAVRAAEDVLCSSSEESDSEQGKPHKSVATPKMDVQTLISAIQNLSDLLVFSCSSNECALKEQDNEALKHVMSNLDSLLSQRMVYMTQQKEPLLPQFDNSEKVIEYLHPPKVDHPQWTEERTAASFQPSSSLKCDLDCSDDDNISKAIKKALDEDSYFGEEEHSALLFKSLWLDAEAKLCSISYRARFDRMKIEMEKLKSKQVEDVTENVAAPRECSRSENSHAQNTSFFSPLDVENVESVLTPKTATHNSSSNADGVEASVMARLHMLNTRDDPKPSNLVLQQPAADVEASAMTRLHILKNRYNPNPITPVGQQEDIVQPVHSDDSAQSPGNSEKRNQLSAGSTDNSSSGWEHVLKDDFLWRCDK